MQAGDEQIGLKELIARLIEAAKAYARAEVELIKRTITVRAGEAIGGIVLAFVALMVTQAALTIGLAAIGMWIASAIGAGWGFAIAAVIGFALAALLARLAIRSLSRIGGKP